MDKTKIFMFKKHLIFFLFVCNALFSEKPEYWQYIYLNLGSIKRIDFTFKEEYRFKTSNFKLVNARFSLLSRKSFSDSLYGGINLTVINARNSNETNFKKIYRCEFVLGSYFELIKDLTLECQNQFELLKHENEAKWLSIFRQKHLLSVKIDKKFIKYLYFSDEFFYNFNKHEFFEYRVTPFELGVNTHFKIFSMIKWQKNENWNPEYIVGTSITF